MPATKAHIDLNESKINALKEDFGLKNLVINSKEWATQQLKEAKDAGHYEPMEVKGKMETPEQAAYRYEVDFAQKWWAYFVARADAKKIADKIPSSVGKRYSKKYGTLAARPKRGALNTFELHPKVLAALAANATNTQPDMSPPAASWDLGDYRGTKLTIEVDGLAQWNFRNRRNAVYALEALLKRVQFNIVTSAAEGAKQRQAINSLLKKVDI